MTFYKVHISDGESKGYDFFTSLKDAKEALNTYLNEGQSYSTISKVDFNCNKQGIISLLMLNATHADNG